MSAVDGVPSEMFIMPITKCNKCGMRLDSFSHGDDACKRIAELVADNQKLKSENLRLLALAIKRGDEILELETKLAKAKKDYDDLYHKSWREGYEAQGCEG